MYLVSFARHTLSICFWQMFAATKTASHCQAIEDACEWGSSVFSQPLEDAREVIKFITRHGKPTSIFSDICINPNTWSDAEEPQPNFTMLVKYCETRFASNLLMLQRYEALQIVIKSLVASNLYITWLRGQDKEKKEKGKAITLIV